MPSIDDNPIVHAPDADAFDAWLAEHHDSSDGIWLAIAKKGGGAQSVSYSDAVDVALCWGWIDGQKKKLDDVHSLQRFTPRRARSRWSKVNVDRVARLTKAKRMQPSGLAEVERAKADGRWAAAYDSPSNMTVPDDFAAALDKNKQAAVFFETISAANRYAILYRIHDAKKPETRTARIEKFVDMLAEGKTLH
jgi:uncharacterized protein YdeI (YjbR/CyaY-like superfamily)